jgi:hypothetical protein
VHPDRQQASQDEGQHAAEQFARLHRAYEVLSDPESRAKYDRYLAAGLNLSYDTWLGTPTHSTHTTLHSQLCSLTLRLCACAVVRVRLCGRVLCTDMQQHQRVMHWAIPKKKPTLDQEPFRPPPQ